MPSLSQQLENHAVGHFGFSATPLHELKESSYTLVDIVFDHSGSVDPFQQDLEKMLDQIIDSCILNTKANNLLIRLVKFNHSVEEIHGYKMLSSINKGDYSGVLDCKGGTALFDACVNVFEGTKNYAKMLNAKDYDTNSVCFIITDGEDLHSTLTTKRVKEAYDDLVTSETVESSVCVLVKVNVTNAHCAKLLDDFASAVGIQSIDMGAATPSSLAKLGGMISKSISSQSKSLGSGTAGNITF